MLSMSMSVNDWSKVLSPRERAVARLLGGGLSTKEVARELGLSPGTVKIHVHNIFAKLGARSHHYLIAQRGTKTRAAEPAAVGARNRRSRDVTEHNTDRKYRTE
jgi:DNA-binding CsgD family transcriptional regulator